MNQSEVVFEYKLGAREMLLAANIYNSKLCGLQLQGTVIDVLENKVKLHLNIDKNQSMSDAYAFDWYPAVSNIMYCMPDIGEKVNLYLYDSKGETAAVINCLRNNANTCTEFVDPAKKIFTYKNKTLSLYNKDITFRLDDEKNQNLVLSDINKSIDYIFKNIKIFAQKQINISAKFGTIQVQSPYQIEIKQLDGEGATLSINQTIECYGKAVNVQAQVRIDYPAFNDAPVVVKKNWGKLLLKILAAVVIVAAVAVAVGVLTTLSGGTFLAGALVVGKTALIGGAVCSSLSVVVQINQDNKNKIKRGFLDYLYLGVDEFCTGAILSAPMALPGDVLPKLIGVAACSCLYQGVDKLNDWLFGGDFYDEDSNMVLNVAFDVAFAALSNAITDGLKKLFKKGCDKLTNLKLSKKTTKQLTRLWNVLPYVKKLPKKGGYVNTNKHIIRNVFHELLPQKLNNSKLIWYLFLGGKEGTDLLPDRPGADIPTSLITDENINPLLGLMVDCCEDLFMKYDDSYTDYSVLVNVNGNIEWIDIDEHGNLVFE